MSTNHPQFTFLPSETNNTPSSVHSPFENKSHSEFPAQVATTTLNSTTFDNKADNKSDTDNKIDPEKVNALLEKYAKFAFRNDTNADIFIKRAVTAGVTLEKISSFLEFLELTNAHSGLH